MNVKDFLMKRYTGRTSRKEYWLYQLNWWISALAIAGLIYWVGLNCAAECLQLFILDFVYSVGLLAVLSGLSWTGIMVRRFHDIGKSGKSTLLILIPVIGWILIALMAARPSEAGENKYGIVDKFSWKKSYQPWILGVSLLVLVGQPGSWFITQQLCASFGIVTEVKVPCGIKYIPSMAFYECSSLEKVVVPEGVVSIGALAFEDCTALREVSLPESLEKIGSHAFDKCKSLSKIVIPSRVKIIEFHIFDNCTALKEVVIPEGVTEIGMEAFAGCTSLKEITIPKSVQKIKFDVFARCTALETVRIKSESVHLSGGTFKGCSGLKEVFIEGRISTDDCDLFRDCMNLKRVWAPFRDYKFDRQIPYGVLKDYY